MNNRTEQPQDEWDVVSRFLHWLSAVWIFSLIGLGLVMVNMIQASGLKFELYQLHKSYGFLFGLLLIIRVLWKLFAQRPKTVGNSLMNFVSGINQLLMLFLLILLVASGYAMASLSIIPIPINILGSFEFRVGYRAWGLIWAKSSFPAIRNRTVRIVAKRL